MLPPPALHRSAAIGIVLLAIGVGALWIASHTVETRRSALNLARAAEQQTMARVLRTEQETEQIRHVAARLASLRLSPLGAHPQSWLEPMTRVRTDPRLFELSIHPEGSVAEQAGADGLPTIRLQRLILEADLLHEEGLAVALEALTNTERASAIPLGCMIERKAQADDTAAPNAPPLRARCELDWLTLHANVADRQ